MLFLAPSRSPVDVAGRSGAPMKAHVRFVVSLAPFNRNCLAAAGAQSRGNFPAAQAFVRISRTAWRLDRHERSHWQRNSAMYLARAISSCASIAPQTPGSPAPTCSSPTFPASAPGIRFIPPKTACRVQAGLRSTRRASHFPCRAVAPFPVNRYVIAKGTDRLLVLYWYLAHDRAVASEYWAKIYLVTDSIRMNRSDGSLVRLNTRMLPGESVEAAMARLTPFAGQVVPLLNEYIPQ